PSVPGFMVTYSRIRLRAPISSRARSPRNFRSCGISPTEAEGKTTVSEPIKVSPVTTTWDFNTTPSASRTCAPTTQNGPISTPAPISAPGSMTAEGWIFVSAIGFRIRHGGEFGLRAKLAIDQPAAFEFPDLAAATLDRDTHFKD